MIRLAITIGDIVGIGPELILKTLPDISDRIQPVVYGSRAVLDWTAKSIEGLAPFFGEVIELPNIPRNWNIEFGKPSAFSARLQYDALCVAVQDALEGTVDAVVTAPWTKYALALADLEPTGHTEVIAAACGGLTPTMMLCGDRLRVALVTTHLPLLAVPGTLTEGLILGHLESLHSDLRSRFGIDDPEIAVCGLNPHAGEGGTMGKEDEETILPAISEANKRGIHATGPYPADTLFARVVRSDETDAVLAMYHDQGLGPLKLWHFGDAVNVTLGLPIIRTSPDHGTAYDIAGKGIADPSSFRCAIRVATEMVGNQYNSDGSNRI